MQMFDVECPACARKIKAKSEFVGRRVKCPGCQQPFLVTQPKAAESTDDFDPDNPFSSEPLLPTPPPTPKINVALQMPALESYGDHLPYAPAPSAASVPMVSHLPMSRSYPALQTIRMVLLILAILVALAWVWMLVASVFAVLSALSYSSEMGGSMLGISLIYMAGTFLVGATVCCFLIAARELIRVTLDIQENTLAAARR